MIPLSWFLVLWLIFIAIFCILTLITVKVNLRFAPASNSTYITTALFLIVILVVFVFAIPTLVATDWSQMISLFGSIQTPF